MRGTVHALSLAGLALASAGLSAAPVEGEVTEFRSASGLVEQCIRIAAFPGAHYASEDLEQEQRYCALDFSTLALCPKLWSTSPGTILYEIEGTDYAGYEKANCADGHHAWDMARSHPGNFKVSVNARDTSATYAPSSWVYYHLSRYFRTNVHVPVAVYRSTDAQAHHQRVVKPALAIVADRHGLGMLRAGWHYLDALETGELGGAAAAAAMTDDGRQLFGVLLDSKGDRYGAEINGTRESGWGAGQNHDFQQTAPFLALRSELPVAEAAAWSVREARKNPRMAKDLQADTSVEQVVFWMQDILEITLLDFVLGQQDRIGNIDYNWRWYWLEDGELQSVPAQGREVPANLAAFKPIRLRQSAINDNDAGVRAGYADFAAKTHMLEGLRHYNAELYQRLGLLARDFAAQGPAHQWLTASAGLSSKEAQTISDRLQQAFALLQADCRSGALQLDLHPAGILPGVAPKADDAAQSCLIGED
ncbi:hypothetical protein N9M39_00220 [Halieaceae bacterium]|nr:hypothetical protein [Halieaceae bacterium]